LLAKALDATALAAQRPGIVLVVMALLGLSWRIAYSVSSEGYARQLLWLPAFLDWFAAGMMLAWLRERPQALPEPIRILANMPGVCWSLGLAGYWMITTNLGGPYGLTGATTGANMTKHLTYLVVATLLLLPAVLGDPRAPWRRVATHPIMTWLGRISFGVFLWHPMLMEFIRRVLGMEPFQGGFWITLMLTLAASLLAGTLSWKFVEAPSQQRWRNGFGSAATSAV
jgi:peptidoglycan/LPS O-acetylase OafA/YrhL